MKNSTRAVRAILPVLGILLCTAPAFAQVLKGSTAPQRNSATISRTPPANLRMITSEADYEKLAVQAHYVPVNGTARTIRNLAASSAQMSLFSQLSQQKQSANTDLMQIRAARMQKAPVAVQPQAGMLNSRMASAANTRTVATMPSSSARIGPGTVQSEKTGTSRYAVMPSNIQVNACAFSNGQLAIGKMTGPGQAMTFTPIPEYNLYTIRGCNFGDAVAGNKAWIYAAGFHADFGIEEWSDSMIVLKLGENISGVGDLSNLTLVVHRADGKEAQATGYKFYAARIDKPIMLKYVPPGWRKFDYSVTGVHHWGWKASPTSDSPIPPNNAMIPSDARNSSIYVTRGLTEKFSKTATDYFDFSKLPPGWVVDSVMWENYPTNCFGVVTSREEYGQWNVNLNGSTVQVDWGDESCSGWVPPFFGYQDHTASTYSLQVFVKGPRGTDNLLPHM